MRFKNWKTLYVQGSAFRVPSMFLNTECYGNFTIYPNEAFQGCAQSVELYLGIEAFDKEKAADYQYLVQAESLLEGVQQHYVNRKIYDRNDRIISQTDHWKLKKGKALFQAIVQHRTKTYEFDEEYSSTTFLASFQQNEKFYVVQLTGQSDVMPYLLQDFKKIVYSCK
jgi:hypothetical protein